MSSRTPSDALRGLESRVLLAYYFGLKPIPANIGADVFDIESELLNRTEFLKEDAEMVLLGLLTDSGEQAVATAGTHVLSLTNEVEVMRAATAVLQGRRSRALPCLCHASTGQLDLIQIVIRNMDEEFAESWLRHISTWAVVWEILSAPGPFIRLTLAAKRRAR
ncbi:MAG: hypothetical protein JSS72_07400 [Armatimonadetes bacterium]|nr:hypothetical protein [Armatimonadota bacterium]